MSLLRVGTRQVSRRSLNVHQAPSLRRNIGDWERRDGIILYGVPTLATPADIQKACAGRLQDVQDVQLVYRNFRPDGRAMITISNPELISKTLRLLKPLHVCGVEVHPVANYSLDIFSQRQRSAAETRSKEVEVIGSGAEFPHIERSVVLWGMPGSVSEGDVARALTGFKTELKDGKPLIQKLPKPEKFSIFSRFVIVMSSVSEARRLARAWHLTPWFDGNEDLIRAQALH
ncbi:hypothetical protein H0H93_007221 [Arthromyces matolae]|nr:hypothetical protein H0H93_007221 [Arthromyces matolae]